MQITTRWAHHSERARRAMMDWCARVGMRKILAYNTGPFAEAARAVDPGDQEAVDQLLAKFCPLFRKLRKDAANGGLAIGNFDRERAWAVVFGFPPLRAGDILPPGTAVSQPASGGVGGFLRKKLKPTFEGTTAAGVDWKDEYPLASRVGKFFYKSAGENHKMWMAVCLL